MEQHRLYLLLFKKLSEESVHCRWQRPAHNLALQVHQEVVVANLKMSTHQFCDVIEQQEPRNEDETAILHLKRKREEVELESFKKKLAEEDEDRQEERELKRLQREVEKKKLIKELASL